MSYGKIEYDQEGNPKCEICGLFFKRVLPHVWQKHEMNQRDYKMLFGFDLIKGICSEKSAAKTRRKTLKNYEKCIRKNLNIRGKSTRFIQGEVGRTKDMVSEQTRNRLRQRIIKYKKK